MADTCIKIHALEKALKDPSSAKEGGRSYLDVCLADDGLDNRPGFMFWTSTAKSFERCAQDACKCACPALHASWGFTADGRVQPLNSSSKRSAVKGTPNSYVSSLTSWEGSRCIRIRCTLALISRASSPHLYPELGPAADATMERPETVLLLRAIQPFERLYVERSTSKMNEAVAEALKGGVRSPPGATEGLAASRVLSNELDAVRFDPLLVRTVARNVARAMDSFGSRIDGLVRQPLPHWRGRILKRRGNRWLEIYQRYPSLVHKRHLLSH